MTALQPLIPGNETRAFAISDTGIVVGYRLGPRNPSPDCSAAFTPVMWDRNGNVTQLPKLLCEGTADPLDLFPEGLALDVNNQGRAVGLHLDFVGQGCFPFVTGTSWDAGGAETALMPPAGYFDTSANSVNNNGLMAGETFDFGFFGLGDLAVIWDRDGNATTLAPLDGDPESTGQGINDSGAVAGSSGAGLFSLFQGTTPATWSGTAAAAGASVRQWSGDRGRPRGR